MRYLSKFLCAIVLFSICFACQPVEKTAKNTNEISFHTNDSIQIIGDLYELKKDAPIILLFHQGGSNATAEYHTIIPELQKKGFNILAIDQRLGGQRYGSYNRTIETFSLNPYNYCDAYPDVEAALQFVVDNGFTGKKILWGSSYSATLAIQLASKNQEIIDGVLAFSPASGGPMEPCKPDTYFETLKKPLLVLRPSSELQREASKQQFELIKKSGHQAFEAVNGVHGSSMLVESRVRKPVDKNWETVLAFLDGITAK